MKRRSRGLVVAAVAIALAGCGDETSTGGSGGDDPAPDASTTGDAVGDEGATSDVGDSDGGGDLGVDGGDAVADADDGVADEPADADTADSGAGTDAADGDPQGDAIGEADREDPERPRCTERGTAERVAELEPGADWSDATLPRCAPGALVLVMPRGAHWRIEVDDAPADARLFAYGPRFGRPGETPPAAGRTEVAGEAARLELELIAAVAGEQFVVVEREDARGDDLVRARAVCVEGCELEATRFPVVLVHGYAGVDSYFGVLDYFYDIRDPLRAAGYEVYTPVMDAIATSANRAAQLSPQIDAVLEETGARAVNIIAHSQGGLDARYLVATMGYGDRVASITTVATPHHGIGAVLFDFLSAQSFDPDDIEVFNAENPDDARVRYWSWSARTCGLLAFDCQRSSSGETVDAFLIATHTLLGRFGENDGIVPTASMTWGEPLGMVFADHFDEVGQIADGSPDGDPFDHRAFYRSEVRRLRAAGF